MRASKRSAESKYAQIVRLVEEAQAQKAPIHLLADRYAVWFTIVAIALAGLSWAVSGDSVYALAVLVVATPCPLILATPIAIMSGIDLAAHNGIIAKSGAAIEQLGEVDIAVFDKTGTLALGIPKVTAIIIPEATDRKSVGTGLAPSESQALSESQTSSTSFTSTSDLATMGLNETSLTAYNKNTLLRFAASVEQLSTHILARAVVDAALERDIELDPVKDFEETFGKGVQGRISILSDEGQLERLGVNDVVEVAVGNHTFMRHLEITVPPALLTERKHRIDEGQICSFIAADHQIAGLLVLEASCSHGRRRNKRCSCISSSYSRYGIKWHCNALCRFWFHYPRGRCHFTRRHRCHCNSECFACEQDYIVIGITSLCAACDTLRPCCDWFVICWLYS